MRHQLGFGEGNRCERAIPRAMMARSCAESVRWFYFTPRGNNVNVHMVFAEWEDHAHVRLARHSRRQYLSGVDDRSRIAIPRVNPRASGESIVSSSLNCKQTNNSVFSWSVVRRRMTCKPVTIDESVCLAWATNLETAFLITLLLVLVEVHKPLSKKRTSG